MTLSKSTCWLCGRQILQLCGTGKGGWFHKPEKGKGAVSHAPVQDGSTQEEVIGYR